VEIGCVNGKGTGLIDVSQTWLNSYAVIVHLLS